MTSKPNMASDIRAVLMLVFVLALDTVGGQENTQSHTERIKQAKQALDYVQSIASSGNCSGGTGERLLLNFDKSAWVTYTDPAIRVANFLSQVLATNNNTLEHLDDSVFYDFVRNIVHGDTLIFGSGIPLEPDVLSPGREMFCPYAAKAPGGGVRSFDIALFYEYDYDTEWYRIGRDDFSGVPIVNDSVIINQTEGELLLRQPVANYSHGRWTFPYYDCGGGDIWMVTYSAPILALNDQDTPVFKGIATVDLELTHIDINQCDALENEAGGSLDVFRGTHNCQPTTKCVPIKNLGFNRGSYNCECLDGYYFPDTKAVLRAYRGVDIDQYFSTVHSLPDNIFQCLPCSRGCDTCVDERPCLYEYNIAIRILVVVIVVFLIFGCCALFIVTLKYKTEMVMKTASPMFLLIMIQGAVLMCMSVFLMYPEPTDLLCTLFVWPFHLGFSLLYGSLILKTWRISVIFSSRKKVNLPDKVLLRRLVPILTVMTVYLACWTVLDHPHVITVTMPDTKKFFSCSFDYWNYAIFGVEALLLLFGVYLCFTVRKAPAHFNESKHITWSTYNGIILGIFIIVLTQFLSQSAGPDVVYVLLMLQLQVFVTITLGLIFVPKFWALYQHTEDPSSMQRSVTGRTKTGPVQSIYTVDVNHIGVQVTPGELEAVPSTDSSSPNTVKQPLSGQLRTNSVLPLHSPAAAGDTTDDTHEHGPALP